MFVIEKARATREGIVGAFLSGLTLTFVGQFGRDKQNEWISVPTLLLFPLFLSIIKFT